MSNVDIGDVVAAIDRYDYELFSNERELQEQAADHLKTAGFTPTLEQTIGNSRFDIVVGGIVIEVKVKGSPSSILLQLERYAQFDHVDGVVLLTAKAGHRTIKNSHQELNGKPFVIAHARCLS